MLVKVLREGEVIGTQIQVATNFFCRLRGLLGRARLEKEEGLLLLPCRQVHTFFMSFAIDVLFLDKQGKIVELMPEMTPGHASPLVKDGYQVLELPAGTVKLKKLQKGEQLVIQTLTI